jgi:hypothetical protein
LRGVSVAELAIEHGRVALELDRSDRGLGRPRRGQGPAAIEALEHGRQLGPALGGAVELGQRGERVAIGGRGAQGLFPALERGDVVLPGGGDPREPLEQLGALGGRARRGGVVLEGPLEPRIAGLVEHALHALEGVAIAGQELEHGARCVDHAVDVGEPGLVEDREPAQHGQPLGALGHRPFLDAAGLAGAHHRFHPTGVSSGQGVAGPLPRDRSIALGHHAAILELEHPAQRVGEPGVVALALVQVG